MLCGCSIDLLGVTETYFKSEFNHGICSLYKFEIIRHDRVNGNSGAGIAIYCQKGLQYKILFDSEPSDPIEYIEKEFKKDDINKHTFYENIIVYCDKCLKMVQKR